MFSEWSEAAAEGPEAAMIAVQTATVVEELRFEVMPGMRAADSLLVYARLGIDGDPITLREGGRVYVGVSGGRSVERTRMRVGVWLRHAGEWLARTRPDLAEMRVRRHRDRWGHSYSRTESTRC